MFTEVFKYEQARDLYASYVHSHRTSIVVTVIVEAGLLYFSAGVGNVVIKLAEGSALLARAAAYGVASAKLGGLYVLFRGSIETGNFGKIWYNYKSFVQSSNDKVYDANREIVEYARLLKCYKSLIQQRVNSGLNPYYDVAEYAKP